MSANIIGEETLIDQTIVADLSEIGFLDFYDWFKKSKETPGATSLTPRKKFLKLPCGCKREQDRPIKKKGDQQWFCTQCKREIKLPKNFDFPTVLPPVCATAPALRVGA